LDLGLERLHSWLEVIRETMEPFDDVPTAHTDPVDGLEVPLGVPDWEAYHGSSRRDLIGQPHS
jgi:hypothetical protein